MNKLRVLTVVGTRPEIIRLSQVIKELDLHFDHIFVHTGQNHDYELNQIFFKQLNIRKPDIFLDAAGNSASETIGNIIIKIDKVLIENKPDAFLILGDTNSCMSAIAAKRRKIPIFHMEAGNRCFDSRVPEEIIRKIVDHIADINLPYTDIAKDYLMKEGIPSDRIIKTGSPMKEIIQYYMKEIENSEILDVLMIKKMKYFLVSSHREENIDSEKNFKAFLEILNAISDRYDIPVIVSTHPRTRKKINSMEYIINPKIRFLKPFGFLDYIKLQINSFCVLSDSGSITEESSILNFPALNIREMNERPEGFEEGSVMMVGMNLARILTSIEIIKNQNRNDLREFKIVKDYNINNVSKKIVRIIQSYTDYINRNVWKNFN